MFCNGAMLELTIHSVYRDYDLAILRPRYELPLHTLPLCEAHTDIGSIVIVPWITMHTLSPSISIGFVSNNSVCTSIDREMVICDLLQIQSGYSAEGISGAPILSLMNRCVAGIVLAKSIDSPSLLYALPSSTILTLIKNGSGRSVKNAKLGLRLLRLTSITLALLGLPGMCSYMVIEVLKNSLAEEMGFKRGDILVKCNDRAITSLTDIRECIDEGVREFVVYRHDKGLIALRISDNRRW